jgi:hypothetical protein
MSYAQMTVMHSVMTSRGRLSQRRAAARDKISETRRGLQRLDRGLQRFGSRNRALLALLAIGSATWIWFARARR